MILAEFSYGCRRSYADLLPWIGPLCPPPFPLLSSLPQPPPPPQPQKLPPTQKKSHTLLKKCLCLFVFFLGLFKERSRNFFFLLFFIQKNKTNPVHKKNSKLCNVQKTKKKIFQLLQNCISLTRYSVSSVCGILFICEEWEFAWEQGSTLNCSLQIWQPFFESPAVRNPACTWWIYFFSPGNLPISWIST